MTGKRSIESDLEDLSDDVLQGLPPKSRLRMMAEAESDGDDSRLEKLRETIPKREYRGIDHEYRQKATRAHSLSWEATYGLHMAYMEYKLAKERTQKDLLNSLAMPELYDEDADSPLDGALDHEEIMDRNRQKVKAAAVGLYVEYHANKRFAEEHLDVGVDKFLALSPPGWLADVDFEAVVAQLEDEDQIPDPIVTADDDGETEEMALEDAVETLYDEILLTWEGETEEVVR